MWIHHWVVLQFLHLAFAVPGDLSEFNDRGRFKHSNWADFICDNDADYNKKIKSIGWNGLGRGVLRETTISR